MACLLHFHPHRDSRANNNEITDGTDTAIHLADLKKQLLEITTFIIILHME